MGTVCVCMCVYVSFAAHEVHQPFVHIYDVHVCDVHLKHRALLCVRACVQAGTDAQGISH